MENFKLLLGKSKAGHDIRQNYVVVAEDDIYYYLANGTTKLMSKPKKKKKFHVQPIKHLPKEVTELVAEGEELTDLKIKRILKVYNSLSRQEEQDV
ncbi:MAG: hypothetical protein HUJ70_03370 [Pseudobutyrivibrio sp.]|nr:hypothetical protein [Pseudobutyrivibrio sp.]